MPLKKAVRSANAAVVSFLLENDCAPAPEDRLLHQIARIFNSSDEKEIRNMLNIADMLLPYCDVNSQDEDGNSPLHLTGNLSFAMWLLNHGADMKLLNNAKLKAHECSGNNAVKDYLHSEYNNRFPEVVVIAEEKNEIPAVKATDWVNRFSTQTVTLQELIPVDGSVQDRTWNLNYLGKDFKTTPRFVTSLAKKMKFSTNIFKYFSPEEVLLRVAEHNPGSRLMVTFDHHANEILGVIDEDKKILPPQIACQVFAEDPRIREISYQNGLWSAELHLDESFKVRNSGDYFRRLEICYPVDGVGMPCIYLAMLRQVCSNGSTARVAEFRTDIEISDESGLHLSRLLKSFNNQYGFAALEDRLTTAQSTAASVGELMEVDNLLQTYVADKHAYRTLHNRLDEIAGEPCFTYGTTSLNNIPAKKRALLPVNCSVNDLLNFCSELTTHHSNLLNNSTSFDVATGKILAHEFDLEGMYRRRTGSPDFFLKGLDLPKFYTRESRDRLESTVTVNG